MPIPTEAQCWNCKQGKCAQCDGKDCECRNCGDVYMAAAIAFNVTRGEAKRRITEALENMKGKPVLARHPLIMERITHEMLADASYQPPQVIASATATPPGCLSLLARTITGKCFGCGRDKDVCNLEQARAYSESQKPVRTNAIAGGNSNRGLL